MPSPATVVQKFGGSSVADVPRLRAIAQAVMARSRAGDRVVVVVSAMGKTTDQLISQARSISPDPPRRELDMLVTAGERISMALLSMAIHEEGGQAISFTGSQSGIITDDQHQGASILEVRPERIEHALGTGKIVIVAGYQGVSRQREITTLGRGGSDTTAVALAAALAADACEIYSDVDGVYSADPNVCPQARLLNELPFEAMQAMAGAGAKVLNADAVEFARRAGITIVARKTGDASGRQTLVHAGAPRPSGVVAVVGASAVSRVALAETPGEPFWEQLARLGARLLAAGEASLLVDRTGIPGRDEAPLAALARTYGMCCVPTGLVTLVGTGLLQRALRPAQVALDAAGIAHAGWVGHDGVASVLVPHAAVDEAVCRLHAALVG
ncbi:MAG TPA: aspartate kinase [Myxococcota bacterium]|nr:aspartate kinase [Myxococcota bacterium]